MSRSVLIIGVGNPDRGDDALGWIAAERLAVLAPPGARVLRCSGDILTLIEEWRSAAAVILIDASPPQTAPGGPGAFFRLDAGAGGLPAELTNHSTHGFGVAVTIELARALGALPPVAVIYAMEGQSFEPGAPLSPPVAAAMGRLVDQVANEARALLQSWETESAAVSALQPASDRKSR